MDPAVAKSLRMAAAHEPPWEMVAAQVELALVRKAVSHRMEVMA